MDPQRAQVLDSIEAKLDELLQLPGAEGLQSPDDVPERGFFPPPNDPGKVQAVLSGEGFEKELNDGLGTFSDSIGKLPTIWEGLAKDHDREIKLDLGDALDRASELPTAEAFQPVSQQGGRVGIPYFPQVNERREGYTQQQQMAGVFERLNETLQNISQHLAPAAPEPKEKKPEEPPMSIWEKITHNMRRVMMSSDTLGDLRDDPEKLKDRKASLETSDFVNQLPGAVAGVVSGFTRVAETVSKGADQLYKWNEGLRQADFQFAEFSSSMAQVQAEAEARDIQLSRERGERRAESAKFREESYSELKETFAPVGDFFANMGNYLVGGLNKAASNLGKLLGLGDRHDPAARGGAIAFPALYADDFERVYGRPARLRTYGA